jgi:putative membrane protein
MSDLNDPRVLFAAERTLLAWVRTAAGLMAMGLLIDRSAVLTPAQSGGQDLAFLIGVAFVILGVVLLLLSVVQYRRTVAELRAAEIPEGYWVNLSVYLSAVTAILGVAMALYLAIVHF